VDRTQQTLTGGSLCDLRPRAVASFRAGLLGLVDHGFSVPQMDADRTGRCLFFNPRGRQNLPDRFLFVP
jgi:hypothetical protein